MRPPVDDIAAPPFPPRLPWINVAALQMDRLLGSPVLIEFWDFCRVNSLRTLPYLRAWHERYAEDGLRVIGVHSSGFPPSEDADEVRAACARLGVTYPVVVDEGHAIWLEYENEGWPARYLFDREGLLHDFHYGEGAYDETERAIQELLGVERELVPPVRPEDGPGVLLPAQTADQPGAYSGPYAAGAAWAVTSGGGVLRANGAAVAAEHRGCVLLVEHERHTEGVLELQADPGVEVYATCFTPARA